MSKIKIGIVGVGNCASSLLQGIEHYRLEPSDEHAIGLMHWDLGGYLPGDIEVASAFDIDQRKVGRDVAEAIFAPPNCTKIFCPVVPPMGVSVKMGVILDGCAAHMLDYEAHRRFLPLEKESTREEIVRELKSSGTEMLLNYLPVGSEEATRFYAGCALEAGVAFINNIPVFIASDPAWVARFEAKGLPLIGDDIKAQLGATILHRTLVDLFRMRGVEITRTYQLNTGGNTDFLNMLNRDRLASKKTSKTEAVQSAMGVPLSATNIHVGPSDYVAWQNDNKICFIRIEGRGFGGVPMEMDLKLSVEDSPNSAGVAVDTIRCCKLALDRGKGGVLHSVSSFFSKHPPRQIRDEEACRNIDAFIRGERED